MKILAYFLVLVTTSALAAPAKEATGWSFLIGRGELNSGRKQAEDLNPAGTTFKGSWSHRTKFVEPGLMVRYGKFTDDFTFEGTDGEFKQTDLTLGAQVGFWAFSWLKVNAGYAYHIATEKVTGDFTTSQQTDITETYQISEESTYGIYGGADLVIVQSQSVQFFANYDYYHLNGTGAHQWEAMLGARFYVSGKSSVGKGNFFVKFFRELFESKNK